MVEKIKGEMIFRFGFVLLFSLSFVLVMLSFVESSKNFSSFQCRLNMTSTCANNEVNKWNTKNIAKNLKEWIKSIAVEWKVHETIVGGRHCKVFIVKKNNIFNDFASDFLSPNTVMLGKVMHQNKKSKYTKYENIKKLKTPQLYGPIWADLGNEYEWNIRQNAQGGSAGLISDAVLGNGLYYGILNNDQMMLGNFNSNKAYLGILTVIILSLTVYIKPQFFCHPLEGDLTFIYPDMKTALTGKFKDGVMKEGRQSKIIAERCNDGIKEIRISKPSLNSPIFSFKRNSRLHINHPTTMDPLEKNLVYVGTTENKGDGLFARRDIEPNQLVSYYSGEIWQANETLELYPSNQTGYDR